MFFGYATGEHGVLLKFDDVLIRQGDFELSANLSVEKGAKSVLIGPSGAGKSTLLGALGGFVPCAKGAILWSGRDITSAAPGERPLSMLFQDNNLFPHLSVAQNVGLGINPNLKLTSDDKARVAQALRRVGLDGFETRKPRELSGGQQSRAALARVLVRDKPLIVLDEPFAALGPALRNEMLDLLGALVDETDATMLMVTHAPEDISRIATHVLFVEGGQVHPPAPAQALMDNPPPALAAYLG